RHRKEIAGPCRDSEPPFRDLDAGEAADEGADDGLAAEEKDRIAPVGERLPGGLEPEERFAANGRAQDRSRDDPPTRIAIQHVAAFGTKAEVDQKSDDVAEPLEHPVGVHPPRAYADVDGEGQAGIVAHRRRRHGPSPGLSTYLGRIMSTLFQDLRFGARLL